MSRDQKGPQFILLIALIFFFTETSSYKYNNSHRQSDICLLFGGCFFAEQEKITSIENYSQFLLVMSEPVISYKYFRSLKFQECKQNKLRIPFITWHSQYSGLYLLLALIAKPSECSRLIYQFTQGGQRTWNFWKPGKVREFCATWKMSGKSQGILTRNWVKSGNFTCMK